MIRVIKNKYFREGKHQGKLVLKSIENQSSSD